MKPADTSAAPANVLLAPWTGPYGGVPPFDQVKVADLQPALEAGMAQQLAEIDRIANDPAAPTFENTIAAMERTGRTLDRVSTVYGVYSSTLNDDAVQAVEREMAPKLAAFSDQITQNQKLFERIAKVYETRETAGLTPEQQRLTWVYYTNFVRAGAKLDAAAKKRTAEINQELARLFTAFGQNVLKDENDGVIYLDKEADLAGPAAGRSRRHGAGRRGPRPEGQVGDRQHALEHRAVPDVFGQPRAARAGLAHVRQPRRQRRRDRQQRDHHADPAAARRARAAARLPDARALAPREHDGEDARARHGTDGSGLDAGRRAGPRRSRGHAEDRRRRKGRHQDRAVGLPLLRRKGAQGEVRPRRDPDHAVHAAREPARRHVPHGEGAVRLQLQAGRRQQGAGVPPRRARLGSHQPEGRTDRPLVLRPVRAQGQALGRVDERLPHPGTVRRRHQDDRLEQLELREGQARRAGADQLGRRDARCSTNSATRCTA